MCVCSMVFFLLHVCVFLGCFVTCYGESDWKLMLLVVPCSCFGRFVNVLKCVLVRCNFCNLHLFGCLLVLVLIQDTPVTFS